MTKDVSLTPRQVLNLCAEKGVKCVDIRFNDLIGTWQHLTIPVYRLDSNEGVWNSGREEGPNLGYKPRHKEGYFPVPPMDQLQDLRTEMCLNLEACGLKVERHHHEVATAGQCEINYRFDETVRAGDAMMLFKYIVKNTALKHK